MSQIRRITELENGEQAFTTTAAAWVTGGRMYLNGNHPIHRTGAGSFAVRLVKDMQGRLLVDLSRAAGERWSAIPAMGGPVDPVVVDEALQSPGLDPDNRRIVDMVAGETAYIDPSEVWVFDNRRMWLNGLTRTSEDLSGKTPLRVHCREHGVFEVDLSYCEGIEYATSPAADIGQHPIQVHSRVA